MLNKNIFYIERDDGAARIMLQELQRHFKNVDRIDDINNAVDRVESKSNTPEKYDAVVSHCPANKVSISPETISEAGYLHLGYSKSLHILKQIRSNYNIPVVVHTGAISGDNNKLIDKIFKDWGIDLVIHKSDNNLFLDSDVLKMSAFLNDYWNPIDKKVTGIP